MDDFHKETEKRRNVRRFLLCRIGSCSQYSGRTGNILTLPFYDIA